MPPAGRRPPAAALLAGTLGLSETSTGVLLGAAALSWLAGVLVPIAPGGLGVRDAALALGLAPLLGAARRPAWRSRCASSASPEK